MYVPWLLCVVLPEPYSLFPISYFLFPIFTILSCSHSPILPFSHSRILAFSFFLVDLFRPFATCVTACACLPLHSLQPSAFMCLSASRVPTGYWLSDATRTDHAVFRIPYRVTMTP